MNFRKEPYLFYSKLLGFCPNNIELFNLAFLHKSSAVRNENGKLINNERLEFLGDAILGAIISDITFRKFENKREGFLTNTRSKVVQRESLNKLALELGLDKLMVLDAKITDANNSIYGNAFEALIGAIYLDQGYDKCKKFIETRILDKYIDLPKLAFQEVNFKSKLIEWSQKEKVVVSFDVIQEYLNDDNFPVFQMGVSIENVPAGVGIGKSKKESQQNAAKIALIKIKEFPSFWEKALSHNSEETMSTFDATIE